MNHYTSKIMLQRIQTVYLALVFVLSGVLSLIFPLWKNAKGEEFFAPHSGIFIGLFGISAALAAYAIVTFNNRMKQFVINRLNMILNVLLLGLFVFRSLNLSGEIEVSEKGIGMVLPVLSILFLVLANRAIKKDEDLVKSVDRLR